MQIAGMRCPCMGLSDRGHVNPVQSLRRGTHPPRPFCLQAGNRTFRAACAVHWLRERWVVWAASTGARLGCMRAWAQDEGDPHEHVLAPTPLPAQSRLHCHSHVLLAHLPPPKLCRMQSGCIQRCSRCFALHCACWASFSMRPGRTM